MATRFMRPNHLHAPARVLRATEEAGLVALQPTPATANLGELRLRASGAPYGVLALTVRLMGGGNPTGYSTGDAGEGAGASVAWRNTADAGTLYRGYIDAIYVTRCQGLIGGAVGSGNRIGTPRELRNGNLGFVWSTDAAAENVKFYRLTEGGTLASTNILATTGTAGVTQGDFVILPSGRLVALVRLGGQTYWRSYFSDDHGATWTSLSERALNADATYVRISLEYVRDMLVAVVGADSGLANSPKVYTSKDGGVNFTLTGTSAALGDALRTCVTGTGRVLAIAHTAALTSRIYEITPGAGFTDVTTANLPNRSAQMGITARDDGVVWALGCNIAAATQGDFRLSVSVDDGTTFSAIGTESLDVENAPTANPFQDIALGAWRGKVVGLVVSAADTGTDQNVFLLTLGEWATVTDRRVDIATDGQPYEHSYFPADYPDDFGWTRSNSGGGATVTNSPSLRIVSTVGNGSYYQAPAAVWPNTVGGTRRIRVRVKVAADGSRANDSSALELSMHDGAGNTQGVIFRFSTTGWDLVDYAANTLDQATVTMTSFVDLLIAFAHDYPAAGSGKISVWYRQDADTEGVWTSAVEDATIAEIVGGAVFRIGNVASTTAADMTWEWVGIAEDHNGLANGFTNPTDLAGRSLNAAQDLYLTENLHLGGFNGGGVPGDLYTTGTTYSYGKESVYRELRPSRHTRTTQDAITYELVLDAGANNVWSVDTVAVFGTNWRQGTFQMNAADAWGAPSVSQALTTVISTGTVGAGNRGPGYVGPATSPNWIPGQFKSDGDAHRFFLEIGTDPVRVYEITDNDADRIYVEDINFSADVGTFYVFGDRAGWAFAAPTVHRYRYARLSLPSQPTADDDYRIGVPILDLKWTPTQAYSWNMADEVAPTVRLVESEGGYRAASRVGPRREKLLVQWDPISRLNTTSGDTELRARAFYKAVEGSRQPLVLWQDDADIKSLRLVRILNSYSAPNRVGELADAQAAIDVLELQEEW